MNTVDITKVAGFNAVDAEGNSLGILSKEDLIEAVKLSLIDDIQAAKTAALADVDMLATDVTEDQLPTDDNPAQIRTLASNGDPKRTSMQALAKVVEGLLPVANLEKQGLMSPTQVLNSGRTVLETGYYKIAACSVHYGQYFAIVGISGPASSDGALIAINWRALSAKISYITSNRHNNFKVYTGQNEGVYELWFSLQASDGSIMELCSKVNGYIRRETIKAIQEKPAYLNEVSIS